MKVFVLLIVIALTNFFTNSIQNSKVVIKSSNKIFQVVLQKSRKHNMKQKYSLKSYLQYSCKFGIIKIQRINLQEKIKSDLCIFIALPKRRTCRKRKEQKFRSATIIRGLLYAVLQYRD